MSNSGYVHGYDEEEQQRLVCQAEYWKDLILRNLTCRPGDSLLEIGCGVGAILGVIGQAVPGIRLSGIDIETAQIDFARRHLARLGLEGAVLRVGDAAELPWPESSFDHVFIMWVVEHLEQPECVLKQAWRVLKPGGSITITETDYSTINIYPPCEKYDLFLNAFIRHFNLHGDAYVGRRLGALLDEVGFVEVDNEVIGLNFWHPSSRESLIKHIDYLAGFMQPVLDEIAVTSDLPPATVKEGFDAFMAIKESGHGALSHNFYRASGHKPV